MCNRHAYEKWKHHKHRRGGFRRWAKRHHHRWGEFFPPANVEEYDDHYELHIAAPGRSKEDFKLSLIDRRLTVSFSAKQDEQAEDARWKRREFSLRGFKRDFDLNDKINTEAIEANYKDGILIVTLPKLEGSETVRQDIDIV